MSTFMQYVVFVSTSVQLIGLIVGGDSLISKRVNLGCADSSSCMSSLSLSDFFLYQSIIIYGHDTCRNCGITCIHYANIPYQEVNRPDSIF